MSEARQCELIMPQLRDVKGIDRTMAIDLCLPETPSLGHDSDSDMDLTSADLSAFPSPPSTAESFPCMGVSQFSDDSSVLPSPGLTGTSEAWSESDLPSNTNTEVTVECDGSQLIHIPYQSPFYFSPGSSRSLGFPSALRDTPTRSPYTSFSSCSSNSNSTTSSCSATSVKSPLSVPRISRQHHRGQTPILKVTRASDCEDGEEDDDEEETAPHAMTKPSQGTAFLLVDTYFLSPSSTNIVFPTLSSASCYFSDGLNSANDSYSSMSASQYSPWGSDGNYDGDLDVPYSALTPGSPMDFWDRYDKDLGDPPKLLANGRVSAY